MSDKPIIFSAPMIRALLDGRKTQTRRILKLPIKDGSLCVEKGRPYRQEEDGVYRPVKPSYAVGDRLWVRETGNWRGPMKNEIGSGHMGFIFYAADSDRGRSEFFEDKNKPAIFMPRWASRFTLTVTAVKVERLQEISEADAQAEGVGAIYASWRNGFECIWNSLHGPVAWDENPWVAAISFTVEKRNIDA